MEAKKILTRENELTVELRETVKKMYKNLELSYEEVYYLDYEVDEDTGMINKNKKGKHYSKDQITRNMKALKSAYMIAKGAADPTEIINFRTKYHIAAFAKGTDKAVAPVNVASFSSIKISWKAAQTVDAKEIAFNENIQIFPIPTKNMISINGGEIIDLEILNLSDAVVYKSSDAAKIDMGDFKSGIYLLRIKTKSGLVVKKLIKE